MRSTLRHSSSARRRRRIVAGTFAAMVLAIAACGSDDNNADTTNAPSDTDAPAVTDAGSGTQPPAATTGGTDAAGTTAGTSAGPATGEPIKVMTVAPINSQLPPYPNIHEAARIYGEWINARGGINGRPLEIVLCDGKGDPNEDANCGRQAADEDVVALVGSFSFDASQLIPILEEENIAMFGSCCPIAEIEFSNPISFVTGSNFAIPAGAVARMVDDGCKHPAVVYIETASLEFATDVAKDVFAFKGFDPDDAKYITIPITAQDYSAQVAQAIDGTDCIYGGIADSNWAAFLPAMESLGGTQRLYGHQGNLNSVIAAQFPELTQDGISVNSYPNIEGPMWDDYRAALEEYDAPDLDWNSLAGLGTWSAYQEFVQIVSGMEGEINNETFLAAVKSSNSVDTGGMVPVLDLSTPWAGMGGAFPSIYNRTVTFDRIDNGVLTATDDAPVDMTEALESYTPGD
jgi:ABC-type branched-subunit amino acid transport system substrate-binding protein